LEGESDDFFIEGGEGSVLGFDDRADASLKGVGEGGFVGDEGTEEGSGGFGFEDVLASSVSSGSERGKASCTVQDKRSERLTFGSRSGRRIERSPLRSAGYQSSSKCGESLKFGHPSFI